ncbi:MAG TPA: pyroglutamyl-peptidase I, partial [Dokdonella sp.]|nr:pyroglutamyl-peptidase I [Dokdonella sp.]
LQPIDQPVVAGAPSAYFTSLPSKAIVARLRECGIPAGPSLSAGSFVCNQVFFAIAHLVATRLPHARGGFVHVPWLPQQAVLHPGQPSMALATMVEGVRTAIECAIAVRDDLRTSGGTTH